MQKCQFISYVKDASTEGFIAKLKHAVYFHRCIQCPLLYRDIDWIVFQYILRSQTRVPTYIHVYFRQDNVCIGCQRAKLGFKILSLTEL